MELTKTFYEQHSRYHVILLSIFATLIITPIVFAYFSSSTTDIKLGDSVIRISSRHGQMEYPDIAVTPAGDTIVVWQDKGIRDYEIFAEYFNNSGQPVGMPFIVNQYKMDDQKYPKIAADAKGNFVIVWQSYKQDGSGSGIYGQRFLSNKEKVGSEFKINTYILDNQSNPAIAMNGQGNFVVAWEGERSKNNAKYKNIYAQRFNADGEMVGQEFQVNKTSNAIQANPDISIDDNNNFAVVWQSAVKYDLDIYGHKFNWSEKNTAGDDAIVNSTKGFDQSSPAITRVGGNKFMVVWQTVSQHKLSENLMLENIKGQMLSNDGKKSGGELQVTVPFFGHQENPDLIQLSSSKIFVVWEEYDKSEDAEYWQIFGQILTANGSASGDPFLINPDSNEWNQKASIASNGNGNVGITWTSSKENRELVNFMRGGQI
jgi:hypothetical protein